MHHHDSSAYSVAYTNDFFFNVSHLNDGEHDNFSQTCDIENRFIAAVVLMEELSICLS